MTEKPLVSVITPVFKPKYKELKRCLASVQGQIVEHVLVLDGIQNISNIAKLIKLADNFGAKLIVNEVHSGISAASNNGIEFASGEYLLFLDQDDYLEPDWQSAFENATKYGDVIYSDTTTRFPNGKQVHTFRKPDWSPTRLMFNMYVSHFFAFKKTLVDKVGGLNTSYDGAQDHEFALRICSVAERIEHIPLALYNWQASKSSTALDPKSKPYAYVAGKKVTEKALFDSGISAEVQPFEQFPGAFSAKFPVRRLPVSFIIPTAFSKNSIGKTYLETCLESLRGHVGMHPSDEILIISGGEIDPTQVEVIANRGEGCRIHIIDRAKFDFSRRVNLAIDAARNSCIILLNDDVEIESENFVNQLVGHLVRENVGVVGALLLFPDGSIQHGGHVYNGAAGHAHYGRKDTAAPFFDLMVDREVSGVTGAVMAFRKETWNLVGGFSPSLPLNYGDVDFCLKIRLLGLSVVLANSAVAIHHESITRDATVRDWEENELISRWSRLILTDLYTR